LHRLPENQAAQIGLLPLETKYLGFIHHARFHQHSQLGCAHRKLQSQHWNKNEIDVDFYLSLSDKVLPVITTTSTKSLHRLKRISERGEMDRHLSFQSFKEDLRTKKPVFQKSQ